MPEIKCADAHGVAVYFPYSNKEYAEMFMAAYSEIGFSETYTSIFDVIFR